MINRIIILLLAFALDCILGDPYSFPHPVRAMGSAISHLEKITRRIFSTNPKGQFLAGAVTAVSTVCLSFFTGFLILKACYGLNLYFGMVIEIIICYQILSPRCLKDESMKVYRQLISGNIKSSRLAVAMIVGRDTNSLSKQEIAKATIETVAENTCDGVIAPIFFFALGGGAVGLAYKAVNTLDSMIGYKNTRYLYFGRFAAKLDDVANYIPARISAVLMVISAFLLRLDGKNALKIYLRDRKNHSSPNSAQTESACAGALNIRLAGDAYYFGQLHQKPSIGDPNKEIEPDDILASHKLMYASALLMLALTSLFLYLLK